MIKTTEEFISQYESLSVEELVRLEKGKADLVDEAAIALEKVLAKRQQRVNQVKAELAQSKAPPKKWGLITVQLIAAGCITVFAKALALNTPRPIGIAIVVFCGLAWWAWWRGPKRSGKK